MSCPVLALTDATFDEELAAAPHAVVVEFGAPWCAPCRAMAPILDALADECGDLLRVCTVNADEETDLARRYDVVSVPTFLIIVGGELRRRMVGARSRRQLLDEVAAASTAVPCS